MPEYPIVDAHLHLWDPARFRMSWLDGNELLDKPYGLAEYRQHTEGLPIEAMVYLQVEVKPAYALLEAEWVVERAREEPRIQALVAWAPLEDGEPARTFLEALVRISPLVKGVRRLIQSESIDFCIQPGFVRGVQLLADYGLSFDLCIYHPQLANTIRLVEQCPQVSFILDHIGKPAIKERLLDPWREEITRLAGFPNVLCKVSGMVTEADHQRWTAEDLRPYLDHVLAAFGEDRVVFGGDWPVCLLGGTYKRWLDALRTIVQDRSAAFRQKLFHDNAVRVYRLA